MPEHPSTQYEEKDVSLILLAAVASGILLFLIVVAAGTYYVIGYSTERFGVTDNVSHPNFPEVKIAERFPKPILQYSPKLDMDAYRNEQKELLSSYAWLDQEAGLARIPITEAKRALLNRQNTSSEKQDNDADRGEHQHGE